MVLVSTVVSAAQALSGSITALAVASNRTFPFVTHAGIEAQGQILRNASGAEVMIFSPLVTIDDLDAWNAFSSQQLTSSFSAGPFLPLWQASPAVSNPTSVSSLDLMMTDAGGSLFEDLISAGPGGLFSAVTNDASTLLSLTDAAVDHASLHGDPSNLVLLPHSLHVAPVYDSLFQDTAHVVGVILSVIGWDHYLLNATPRGFTAGEAILMNDCGQQYTFDINGEQLSLVGSGDLHNVSFDPYKIEVPFSIPPSSENLGGHCVYTVAFYPSDVQDNIAKPVTSSPKYEINTVEFAMDFVRQSINDTVRFQNISWPFVTVPGFEALAESAMKMSGLEIMLFTPLVTEALSGTWVRYSLAFQGWLQEARELALERDPSRDASLYLDGAATAVIYEVNGTNNIAATPPGPFFPIWQLSPPPFDPTLLNRNMLGSSAPLFLSLHDGFFTEVIDAAVWLSFGMSDAYHDNLHAGVSSKAFPTSLHPHGAYVEPLVDGSRIVGLIYGCVAWDNYILAALPRVFVKGTTVLRNTCGQTFTYRLTGSNTSSEYTYLGEGDLHDPDTDSTLQIIPLAAATTFQASCGYFLDVYQDDPGLNETSNSSDMQPPTNESSSSSSDSSTSDSTHSFRFASAVFFAFVWQMLASCTDV